VAQSIGHQCPNGLQSAANCGYLEKAQGGGGRWVIPHGNARNWPLEGVPRPLLSRRRPRVRVPSLPFSPSVSVAHGVLQLLRWDALGE
jgi:hypothetical protein